MIFKIPGKTRGQHRASPLLHRVRRHPPTLWERGQRCMLVCLTKTSTVQLRITVSCWLSYSCCMLRTTVFLFLLLLLPWEPYHWHLNQYFFFLLRCRRGHSWDIVGSLLPSVANCTACFQTIDNNSDGRLTRQAGEYSPLCLSTIKPR